MLLPDAAVSANILAKLQAGNWLDSYSRAVSVSCTLYDVSLNLFADTLLVVEFAASGKALTQMTVQTVKPIA